MQKWEYFVTFSGMVGLSEKVLNEYGSMGWELVSVYIGSGMTFYYFKRPVQGFDQ